LTVVSTGVSGISYSPDDFAVIQGGESMVDQLNIKQGKSLEDGGK